MLVDREQVPLRIGSAESSPRASPRPSTSLEQERCRTPTTRSLDRRPRLRPVRSPPPPAPSEASPPYQPMYPPIAPEAALPPPPPPAAAPPPPPIPPVGPPTAPMAATPPPGVPPRTIVRQQRESRPPRGRCARSPRSFLALAAVFGYSIGSESTAATRPARRATSRRATAVPDLQPERFVEQRSVQAATSTCSRSRRTSQPARS